MADKNNLQTSNMQTPIIPNPKLTIQNSNLLSKKHEEEEEEKKRRKEEEQRSEQE